VVANFVCDPTDIAYHNEVAAVIDGTSGVSRLSIFHVDEDGNFTLGGVSTIKSAPPTASTLFRATNRRSGSKKRSRARASLKQRSSRHVDAELA
jgi:hypothetical protein